ncbi:MAG: hypothetical protein GY729_16870 [Desulfobacteraceae bacterium]|nr:hypothetical protein [Desulfobacteraceae bacterium]
MTITALKSIAAGVGGTLVLAVFCSTFLALEKVLFIIPVFIAFNGALTGYKVVETLKNKIDNIAIFSFVLGLGGGAITFVAVNFTGSFFKYSFLLEVSDLLIYMTVSSITSYLGAKLARRYLNLYPLI